MPCRDDGPRDDSALERLNEVTRMLCGVLDQMETAEEPVTIDDLPRETQRWWTDHKKTDSARRAREQDAANQQKQADELRRSALGKLTDAERRALGVSDK